MIRHWIEAMRLRTLPVSVAGVIAGTGCAILTDSFNAIPALLCLIFAILAQIAANFGNEYYDFKNGIDKNSTGPYPLSHHGLGDISVIIFFGIVPVVLTWYLQTSSWESVDLVLETSITVGLLASNVLMVNNYRDMEDDAAVAKRTTVVIFGRRFISTVYLLSGFISMAIMTPVFLQFPLWALVIPLLYLILHIKTWGRLKQSSGASINPLLGRTADRKSVV